MLYYLCRLLLFRSSTKKNKARKKKHKPDVILKLDDLKPDESFGVHQRWQRVVDFTEKENISISIGVVGKTIEEGGDAYINWIKDHHAKGNVEFWNHGQIHKRYKKSGISISEFRNSSLNQQVEHLNTTQKLAKNKLGFEFETFGAPYNQTDSNTIQALEQFSEIKYWFYPHQFSENTTSKRTLWRIPTLNIEYPVHIPKFYYLWNNLYFHNNEEVIVLQGHPLSWDDKRFNEFKKMVLYMKNQGYEFIMPNKL